MAMRMSGMMSGLDTESIVQQLVAARQTKVDAKKKEQTKINWKQEAWKELNTKLKKLQTKYLSTMRFSDAYSKKTTKVSNSNAVSVITGENAVNGVQSLEVKQLAKTGYLTGVEIKDKDGKDLTALSTMGDIMGDNFPSSGSAVFTVKKGDKYVDVEVTKETTISDILTKMKDVGLNANFDAKNGRFFVSTPDSGQENDFSITASNQEGADVLKALGLLTKVSEDNDKASWNMYKEYANYYVDGDRMQTLQNMKGLIDAGVESEVESYLNQYKSFVSAQNAAKDKIIELEEAKKSDILTDTDRDMIQKDIDAQKEAINKYEDQKNDIRNNYINIQETNIDGNITYSATDKGQVRKNVEDRFYAKAQYADSVVKPSSTSTNNEGYATKINGQNAIIILNDAEFTNESNTFEVNGLTFTALDETRGEKVTITTEQDTDGIYDMIKNFLKEYNEIVNEMDKLYNAESAKDYEPLTDEEKESMSEKEIEKWETKIKDSILRRDDNLSTVNSSLQAIMASGFEVNGKTMYLFDFGIDTLGYFEAADNEKHAYHIDGDADDEFTSNNPDKLKSMIANDPDSVISFFSQLGKSLYDKMFDMSKSVDGYRSFGNFYDDKKMQSDYDSYTSKIKEMETKLAEYEDKWYTKFSKMETALAKMQSNMSAITGLLGG